MPSAISKPEKCIWIRQLPRQRKFIEINFESVHADSCISISCSSYSDKGVLSRLVTRCARKQWKLHPTVCNATCDCNLLTHGVTGKWGAGSVILLLWKLQVPLFCLPELYLDKPYFISSDGFLFCWAALLSASWPLFPVSCSFFLFLGPCLIHARMPDRNRDFTHGQTFLHSWSGSMTLVVCLLCGTTFLSYLVLLFSVSFIGP